MILLFLGCTGNHGSLEAGSFTNRKIKSIFPSLNTRLLGDTGIVRVRFGFTCRAKARELMAGYIISERSANLFPLFVIFFAVLLALDMKISASIRGDLFCFYLASDDVCIFSALDAGNAPGRHGAFFMRRVFCYAILSAFSIGRT